MILLTEKQRIQIITRAAGYTKVQICSPSRKAPLVRARQSVMAYLKDDLGYSYPVIGRYLNRDHTTVLHGVRKHRELELVAK